MSFINLSLEKVKLPKEYKETISQNLLLTETLKKQGFCQSLNCQSTYWRWANSGDISLSMVENEGITPQEFLHRIEMATSGEEFDDFEVYIKKWAAENNKSGDKNYFWGEWFCFHIDNDPRMKEEWDIRVSAPQGSKALYISSSDFEVYKFLISVVSSSLRALAFKQFESLDNDLKLAVNDAGKIESCTETIFESIADWAEYKNIWENTNAVLSAHGITSDSLKLLATVCIASSRIAKKELPKTCDSFSICEKLKTNPEFSEELFFNLQEAATEYYLSISDGYPTKALIKKLVKILVIPLEAFGFGIHYEGIKTILRIFENDSVEGIGLDMYQDNTSYNSDDFGYYDGIENEEYLDSFWEDIDIAQLIK